MRKTLGIFCVLGVMVTLAGQTQARPLLPDGIYLKAVDGQVIRDANSGLWQFEVQDAQGAGPQAPGALSGGTRLTLLPNERLQALTTDVAEYPDVVCRLWARTTAYKGKNYLWIHNYLLLTRSQADAETKSETETGASDQASGNRLEIPASVTRTLSRQHGVRSGTGVGSKSQDSHHVLLNRVGYVGSGDNHKMFVFDGFGRSSAPEPAVRLLPSRVLEQMEREQARSPGLYRFSIAGTTSTYEGKTYLLVQRAFRIYSHGNFTP